MSTRSARTTRLKSRNLRKRVQSKSASSKHFGNGKFTHGWADEYSVKSMLVHLDLESRSTGLDPQAAKNEEIPQFYHASRLDLDLDLKLASRFQATQIATLIETI